jgi:flagellar biogenesis protein FliO
MEYLQQFAAVAGVLAAFVAALWGLRRSNWVRMRWAAKLPKRRRELECLERLALGPQHSLHLVRAGGRLMLVSASPAGCAFIGEVPGEFPDAHLESEGAAR